MDSDTDAMRPEFWKTSAIIVRDGGEGALPDLLGIDSAQRNDGRLYRGADGQTEELALRPSHGGIPDVVWCAIPWGYPFDYEVVCGKPFGREHGGGNRGSTFGGAPRRAADLGLGANLNREPGKTETASDSGRARNAYRSVRPCIKRHDRRLDTRLFLASDRDASEPMLWERSRR
jgi:hypothetical protein